MKTTGNTILITGGTSGRGLAFADQFIKEGGAVKIIPTSSQWFGVTYKEDAPSVERSLNVLIKDGEYPMRLWA